MSETKEMSTSKTSSRYESSGYAPGAGSSSFYKSIKSYSSKGGGHGHGDVSLQQIAEAKEVFGDMEEACKKFKFQIEELNKEHRIEVSKILFKFLEILELCLRL